MNTENIINGIVVKRNELDSARARKNQEIWNEILGLESRMLELAPRIGEMFKVAEALTKNGFWMGPATGFKSKTPRFLTDGINHRFGFYVNHPYLDAPGRNYTLTGYLGIENGGAAGDFHLMIDRCGRAAYRCGSECFRCEPRDDERYEWTRNDYLKDLKRAVKEFDQFEADFYEYARNPVPFDVRP